MKTKSKFAGMLMLLLVFALSACSGAATEQTEDCFKHTGRLEARSGSVHRYGPEGTRHD